MAARAAVGVAGISTRARFNAFGNDEHQFGVPVQLRDHDVVKCATWGFTVGGWSTLAFDPSMRAWAHSEAGRRSDKLVKCVHERRLALANSLHRRENNCDETMCVLQHECGHANSEHRLRSGVRVQVPQIDAGSGDLRDIARQDRLPLGPVD